jgi:hypothetical protein
MRRPSLLASATAIVLLLVAATAPAASPETGTIVNAGRGLPLRLNEDVIRRPGSVFRRQVRAAGQPIPIHDGSLERWPDGERNLSAELGDASKCSLGSGGDAMTAQG